jgi:SAM-dependent methyltransferase
MSYEVLFDGLERAGPGDAESLGWAVTLAGVPEAGRILDAGCGLGADIATLRRLRPGARIVAVDLVEAFAARVRAEHPGVAVQCADMTDPPGGPFDFIWCAGAAYMPGVAACLAAWRGHLAQGGAVAFSDLCWRVAEPAPAARHFWAAEGLEMRGAAELEAVVAGAGYEVMGACWLRPEAWAAYYEPIARRLPELPQDDLTLGFEAEIALWREHGGDYGYRLTVARPA